VTLHFREKSSENLRYETVSTMDSGIANACKYRFTGNSRV